MPSPSVYLLPVFILAILHAVAPAEEGAVFSGPTLRNNALRMLLRKRSLEAALRAPRPMYADSLMNSRNKRDDGDYWIWMPAHGYMPVPRDEVPEPQTDQRDSMGNLLRYG